MTQKSTKISSDSSRKMNSYLKKHKIKKIQFGCGYNRLRGWLNCDKEAGPIYIDACNRLLFSKNVFNYIFCEHFIEHLTLEEGKRFLRECYRIQKKGGIIRISTPNLRYIILTYLDKNPYVKLSQALDRHARARKRKVTSCEFFNDKMHGWGHKFIYDKQMLKKALNSAGYSRITEHKFGVSQNRNLRNLERHADVQWMKFAEPIILEAIK